MLMPSVFRDNLFDDWMGNFGWMDDIERKLYGRHADREMRTDVKDADDHYEVMVDLPGFKKDQITAEVHDGYLTVQAGKGFEKEDKKEDGKYVRQERCSGMMSRSFYIGENVKQEDIKARFEDGVLRLDIPKETPQIEHTNTILIE